MGKYDITLQRGCSFQRTYFCRFPDGDYLEPDDGDVMRFGVKEDAEGEILIEKELSFSTSGGNHFILTLTPEDTIDLPPGRYIYDICYESFALGTYTPIIPTCDFIITRNATKKGGG